MARKVTEIMGVQPEAIGKVLANSDLLGQIKKEVILILLEIPLLSLLMAINIPYEAFTRYFDGLMNPPDYMTVLALYQQR